VLFILNSGTSTDTNALHRSVTELSNSNGPEEEFIAGNSQITHCLPDTGELPLDITLLILVN
jgi:hypothetical protein